MLWIWIWIQRWHVDTFERGHFSRKTVIIENYRSQHCRQIKHYSEAFQINKCWRFTNCWHYFCNFSMVQWSQEKMVFCRRRYASAQVLSLVFSLLLSLVLSFVFSLLFWVVSLNCLYKLLWVALLMKKWFGAHIVTLALGWVKILKSGLHAGSGCKKVHHSEESCSWLWWNRFN